MPAKNNVQLYIRKGKFSMADQPNQTKRADRKKWDFTLFFIFPTDSIIFLDLLKSLKSFTYQNLQDFAGKTVIKLVFFLELCVKGRSTHTLRLPCTYAAKIDENHTPWHISFDNSITRPYLKNLRGFFLTKWPTRSNIARIN